MGTPSRIRRLELAADAFDPPPLGEEAPAVYQRLFPKTLHPKELPVRAAFLRALAARHGHENPILVTNQHIAANLGILLCRLLDSGQYEEAEKVSIHWRRAVAHLERKPPAEPPEPVSERHSMAEWMSDILARKEEEKPPVC